MMSLNKYEVVEISRGDEYKVYEGYDLREAISEARYTRKSEKAEVEIRTNIEESDDGISYSTIDHRIFITIRETGDQLEEYCSLAEAEKAVREMEDLDRDEGNYSENYYAICDSNGLSYRSDLDDMTEEQATADANGIKWMRERTGLNRKQFADQFKIPYRTIQDWEDGKSKPVAWAELALRSFVNQYIQSQLDAE